MNAGDLKVSLNSFRQLDLPNLFINVWDYADKPNCPICKQYQNGQDSYIEFDFVINCLKRQNKNWYDFGKISSATRNDIYLYISRVTYR